MMTVIKLFHSQVPNLYLLVFIGKILVTLFILCLKQSALFRDIPLLVQLIEEQNVDSAHFIKFYFKVKWRMAAKLSYRVTFVIGFVSLFNGVALNEGRWEEEGTRCYLVRPMVFIRAGVLSLASIILGIFYFIIISSAKNMDTGAGGAHQNQDIALARPQFTPQNTQPVFIHEDTYNRLQVPWWVLHEDAKDFFAALLSKFQYCR